jgi:hypothetical protein
MDSVPRRIVIAAALLTLVLAVACDPGPAKAAEGCGTDDSYDWLCKETGEVELGHAAVRGWGPYRVNPEKRVWIGRDAVARMAFGLEATCVLGAVPVPTVIRSRYRGSLFLQHNGSTACSSLGAETKFGVYCQRTALCPVEVSVDGSVLTEWKSRPAAARVSLLAPVREVVLWICASYYRVAVRRSSAGGTSSGESSGSFSPPQQSVVRIEEFGAVGLGINGESTGHTCDPNA